MNFAFQAFLLILLYLPGALFMQALLGRLSNDQEIPVINASLSGRAVAAVVVAILLHAVALATVGLLARGLGIF